MKFSSWSKRRVVRVGFAVVIALLAISTAQTYRIQQTQSRQAMEIYRRHVDQDVALYQLRRTIWMAAMAGRDFLISPESTGREKYHSQLRSLQDNALQLQKQFNELAAGADVTHRFREHMEGFWETLEQLPAVAGGLPPAQRHQFVQQQIVPRRNAAGDTLREFAEMTQQAVRVNESAFESNQKEASTRLQVLLAFSVLIGAIVAWISLTHSEALEKASDAQHLAVEQARRELQLLTGRLMSVQEEERTRLSRELHDEVGQALATMRLEIVRAESGCRQRLPEVLDRLVRARELAERTVAAVRDISALLRPSVLDDLGLVPALRALAEDFSARTGLECELDISSELPPLSDDIATCVYRVVQESLHNAEKHASAKRLRIWTIMTADGRLTVEVEDDGVGFDPSKPGLSEGVRLGILGMRERAAAAGGTLETQSASGLGTRIRLSIPCPAAAPDNMDALANGVLQP